MQTKQSLTEILVCPQCKGRLTQKDKHAALVCRTCKLAYPMQDSIPVMLVNEALPIKEKA